MADGFEDIIARLERQRIKIERALSALRDEEGVVAPSPATTAVPERPAKAKRKGHLTPEGRARLVAALKKRWAAKKAAESGSLATKKAVGKRRRPKKAV